MLGVRDVIKDGVRRKSQYSREPQKRILPVGCRNCLEQRISQNSHSVLGSLGDRMKTRLNRGDWRQRSNRLVTGKEVD